MKLERRIKSFAALGKAIGDALAGEDGIYGEKLNSVIQKQQFINSWFTPGNVREALYAIATELTEENLLRWVSAYPELEQKMDPIKVGLIFAGNIPMAGFHDFLSVLMSGNSLVAKTSSKDPDLIPLLGEILCDFEPEFSKRIEFAQGILSGFDAVIATGSNNSSRYFEYYFGKYPNIIRKNRNSLAVLKGDENSKELTSLGKDIFTYFGLGCRSVSKLYVPQGYNISSLTDYWNDYSSTINHSGYANNYDYNKAIYLVNRQKFHDSGFLLMKEEDKLASPVSVLYYEFYSDDKELRRKTEQINSSIQCIIGREYTPFGHAQSPHLWDYADEIDTIEFLLKKDKSGIL
jgi:hypothetical protein